MLPTELTLVILRQCYAEFSLKESLKSLLVLRCISREWWNMLQPPEVGFCCFGTYSPPVTDIIRDLTRELTDKNLLRYLPKWVAKMECPQKIIDQYVASGNFLHLRQLSELGRTKNVSVRELQPGHVICFEGGPEYVCESWRMVSL